MPKVLFYVDILKVWLSLSVVVGLKEMAIVLDVFIFKSVRELIAISSV